MPSACWTYDTSHNNGRATNRPTHAPMQQFPVAGGELQVGGMPLRGLTEQVGHTPFYAYDRRVIDEQVTLLRHCLPRTAPDNGLRSVREEAERQRIREALQIHQRQMTRTCLLYTSDAADDT